jgi:hypothetical protein
MIQNQGFINKSLMGGYGNFSKKVFNVASNQPYILSHNSLKFSELKNPCARCTKTSITLQIFKIFIYILGYFKELIK